MALRIINFFAILIFFALPTESRAFTSGSGSGGSSGNAPLSSSMSSSVDGIVVASKPIHNKRALSLPNAATLNRHRSVERSLTRLRAGATAAGNDSNIIPPPAPPTGLALVKFYFPCLALWISGPLLSLVDTSFVGLSAKAGGVGIGSSASQLAALGPATTFIDGSLYLFAFLNVATTNLYASALARGVSEKKNRVGLDELPGEGVVRTAAKTSLISGFGLMILLLAVARPLIALYIGEFLYLFYHRQINHYER
jgi:hypothetical protein